MAFSHTARWPRVSATADTRGSLPTHPPEDAVTYGDFSMHSNKLLFSALLISALCLSCNDDNETREECVPGCSGYKFTTCTDKYEGDWKHCPNGCNDSGCIPDPEPDVPKCKQECINNLMFVSCIGDSRTVTTCANGCDANGCLKPDCTPGCAQDGKSYTSCDKDGKAETTTCDLGCDAQKGCLTTQDFEPCPGEVAYFSVCDTHSEHAVSVFYNCFQKDGAWLLKSKRELKCADGCAQNGARCNSGIEDAYKPCNPAKWETRCEDENILSCNPEYHYVDVLNCRDKDSSSMHYICTSVNAQWSCQPECAEDEADGIRECSTDAQGHDAIWQSGCFKDDNDRRYFAYEETISCENTCDPDKASCTCNDGFIWSLADHKCIDPNPPEDPDHQSCDTSEDCTDGNVCDPELLICVEASTTDKNDCITDLDCDPGHICNIELHSCIARPCDTVEDCDLGFTCDIEHQVCVKKDDSPATTCDSDEACDFGYICDTEHHVCIENENATPYYYIKIDDLSPAEYTSETKEDPGIDIDAIVATKSDGTIAYAESVMAYIRGDGTSNKAARKAYAPEAVLGKPDAFQNFPEDLAACHYYRDPIPETAEDEHIYTFLSLGGLGGSLIVKLSEPLQAGDQLDILELSGCSLQSAKQNDNATAMTEENGMQVSISKTSDPDGEWRILGKGTATQGTFHLSISDI